MKIRLETADGRHVQNAEIIPTPPALPRIIVADRLHGGAARVFLLVIEQANRIDDEAAIWIYREPTSIGYISSPAYRDSNFEDPR